MKKILNILVILLFVCCTTACGNKNSDIKATITDNEGNIINMSSKEMFELYDGNEAKFDKYYLGAKITFVGTIKSIDTDSNVMIKKGNVSTHINRIVFEEGYCLAVEKDSKYDLADYNKGDKLKITSGITDASDLFSDFLKQIIDQRVVWVAGNGEFNYEKNITKYETIIEKVE